MSKGKSLLLGLAVGSVAGAIATLLTTPKNGNELRQVLKQNSTKVIEALDNVKMESSQLKEQVVNASRESVIILKDFSKDLKTSVEAWKKDIEPHQNRIADEIKSIEESIQQLEKITKAAEIGPK